MTTGLGTAGPGAVGTAGAMFSRISASAAATQRRASVCGSTGTAAPAESTTVGEAGTRACGAWSCARGGGSSTRGTQNRSSLVRNASCATRSRSTLTWIVVSTVSAESSSTTSVLPRFHSSLAAR